MLAAYLNTKLKTFFSWQRQAAGRIQHVKVYVEGQDPYGYSYRVEYSI
jgi:hypothetical protein